MADIIIVRHGQTDWNQPERYRGRADIHLNATGGKQAEATGRRLAKLPVVAIYSSPLNRAIETAEVIAKPHGLTVRPLPELIDIDYGELEGLTLKQAEEQYHSLYHRWLIEPQAVKFPGGESLVEVRSRAASAVDSIISRLNHEIIVLVSHKVVIGALLIHLLHLRDSQWRQISQETCAVNIFIKQEKYFYATLLNDTCHLTGII